MDAVVLEHRARRAGCGDGRCGAVHIQRAGVHGHLALGQDHGVGPDAEYATLADDLFDRAQQLHLTRGDGGVVEHGGVVLGVDTHDLPEGLELEEHLLNGFGLGKGGQLGSLTAHAVLEKLQPGLGLHAIEQPGIPRHDPLNGLGCCAMAQQPDGGIHSRFAGAQYAESLRHRLALALQPELR